MQFLSEKVRRIGSLCRVYFGIRARIRGLNNIIYEPVTSARSLAVCVTLSCQVADGRGSSTSSLKGECEQSSQPHGCSPIWSGGGLGSSHVAFERTWALFLRWGELLVRRGLVVDMTDSYPSECPQGSSKAEARWRMVWLFSAKWYARSMCSVFIGQTSSIYTKRQQNSSHKIVL
ncbi:unnamed protein product [Prunus armeniaca]